MDLGAKQENRKKERKEEVLVEFTFLLTPFLKNLFIS